MANKKVPLIVEAHPEDYNGYPFISLIEYNDKKYLNIIDNMYKKHLSAYVLDLCSPTGIDENSVIDIALKWYHEEKARYPISIEFSKLGVSEEFSKILKVFSIDYITRVIGPLPEYTMNGPIKVRKRKRKPVPANVELTYKKLKT